VAQNWNDAAAAFKNEFGRCHQATDAYRTEDAELVMIGIGTATGAIRLATDRLREEGIAAGSLRLGLVRPFPYTDVQTTTRTARYVMVVDRDVSFGAEGIIAQEIKAALFEQRREIHLNGFVAGIGGNDISSDGMVLLARQTLTGRGAAVQAGNSLWEEVLA
jgi:pyruvate ferredoxin oxidoreductase alpha subunit